MNLKISIINRLIVLVLVIALLSTSFLVIDTHAAYNTSPYTIGIENPSPTNYFQLGQYRLNLYKNVTYQIENANKMIYYGIMNSAAYRLIDNYYSVSSKWKVTIKSISFSMYQWPSFGGAKNQRISKTSTALSGNMTKPSTWTYAQLIPGGDTTLYTVGTSVTVKFYLTNDSKKKEYTKTFVNNCNQRLEYYS